MGELKEKWFMGDGDVRGWWWCTNPNKGLPALPPYAIDILPLLEIARGSGARASFPQPRLQLFSPGRIAIFGSPEILGGWLRREGPPYVINEPNAVATSKFKQGATMCVCTIIYVGRLKRALATPA